MNQHRIFTERIPTSPHYSSSPLSSQFHRGASMTQSSEDVSFPSYNQSNSHSVTMDDTSEPDTPITTNPTSIMMSSTIGDEEGYDDNIEENRSNRKKSKTRNIQSRRKRITTSASVIIDDRFLNELDPIDNSIFEKKPGSFGKNGTFEEQLVIRFPKHIAEQISCNQLSTDQFEFEFHDERYGTFVINRKEERETFRTILVDLPCIVETYKASKERKTWYKIADICQALIVCDNSNFKAIDIHMKTSSYSWPHGLTSPMRNVRTKRFRKSTSQTSRQSLEEVEAIVSKLIESDKNAISVDYELRDISAQKSPDRQEDPFSIIEDGDLSDDSDLAAEIEYGLLEEKQLVQPNTKKDILSGEESIVLSAEEHSKESFTDFSFLQKSLSARLRMVKDGTKQQIKKSLNQDKGHRDTKEEISSDIVMLFEDIDST